MMRRTCARFVGSTEQAKKILVAYGSQTGTAESFARMMGPHAAAHNFHADICTLNDALAKINDPAYAKPEAMLCICSTYGIGEYPSNAQRFGDALERGQLAKKMAGLNYAVLGLGNSSNERFNEAAKKIDKELKKAGAKSLSRMALSCEIQGSGHDIAYRNWKRSLWTSLGATALQSGVTAKPVYDLPICPASRAEPRIIPEGFMETTAHTNDLLTPLKYDEPPSRHLKFEAPDAKTQHNAIERWANSDHDHIAILPQNCAENVKRAGDRLKIDLTTVVEVTPLPGAPPNEVIDMKKMSYGTLLRDVIDLSAIPSRSFLESMATLCAEGTPERAELEELANDLSSGSAYDKLTAGGNSFSVIDCLEHFSTVEFTMPFLLSFAPRIQARTYSFARDTTGVLKSFHEIVFNIPTRKAAGGKVHQGLCSSMLANVRAGDKLTVSYVPRSYSAPKDFAPLLIVALGSGIATARTTIQRRARLQKMGIKVGPTMLYYGHRHAGKDDLFREEFDKYEAEGLISVVRVASHDQADFRTPMDEMRSSITDFLGVAGEVIYCGMGGSVPLMVENKLRALGNDVGLMRTQGRYHEEYFTQDPDVENLLKELSAAHLQQGSTLATRMGPNCEMFCMQCEQTFKGVGCFKTGVCGKTPEVAALQDALVHASKVLSFYCHRLRALGIEDAAANQLTLQALFSTLTNVNFDADRFLEYCQKVQAATARVKAAYEKACQAKGTACEELPRHCPTLPPAMSKDGLVRFGKSVGVLTRFGDESTQSASCVNEMLVYGIKGIAAYTDHSLMNGVEDQAVYEFLHKALSHLVAGDSANLGKALELCLEAGKTNVTSMAMLYKSNSSLGVPTPTPVPFTPTPGKAILVSGHDLIILDRLLKQTEPLGINVYTHGEMLPAHSYPSLKKHKNLVGNYGGAWMRQGVEFPKFPGPIIMTTNCLTEPHDSYKDRIFTAGAVGWTGVKHIGDDIATLDFSQVIKAAQEAPGFTEADKAFAYPDPVGQVRPQSVTVGFGHETIIGAAPTIIDQIKKGNITRFYLIGGCDGFEGSRSYYTDLVKNLPKTSVVLTLGCGKFRINHLDLGTIGDTGLPRILDMGQCNDSYSAVQVALALAKALDCQVSDLPLSIVLSWFEQKAVAVLLSCLSLGLKPIHIGPTLPAFVTPDVLNVLVKDFGVVPLGNPAEDAKTMSEAKGAA